MSRLIDADKVQKKIESWCWKHEEYNQDDLNELCEIVNNADEEVCEWRIVDRPNGLPIYNTSCGAIRLNCVKGIDTYCNACGRKIKEVEDET